jgi:hypothetical protein
MGSWSGYILPLERLLLLTGVIFVLPKVLKRKNRQGKSADEAGDARCV